MDGSPVSGQRRVRYKTGVDKSKAAKLFIDSYYKDLSDTSADRRKRLDRVFVSRIFLVHRSF